MFPSSVISRVNIGCPNPYNLWSVNIQWIITQCMCPMARSVCLTLDFGLGPILTELILHPEAWDGGRGWRPRDNKAVGSDFRHWLRSIHQRRRLRCLSLWCLHWEQRASRTSVVWISPFVPLLAYGSSSVLTGTRRCGEVKARDLTTSVGQDADQLTLVGDGWTQPADGVGVQVSGDGYLCPCRTCVFLAGAGTRCRVNKLLKSERLYQKSNFTKAK